MRHLFHLAIELGGGSLIDAACLFQTVGPHGFEYSQHAHGIDVGRKLRRVERYLHVTLCGEVVNFGRLHFADQFDERH